MTETSDIVVRNQELVREGYDAFARGDLQRVQDLFEPEAVWHAQRLGQLSGDHKGWDAILQFFGQTMQLTQGTFHIEVLDTLGNERGVAVVVRSRALRADKRLDDMQVHLFRLNSDCTKTLEVYQYVGDGRRVDEFWS